ncbi:RNA-dependent RNA polymerase family protein [Stieleria neptunia]|nr:hypothetical protein [Stieleria neptunia]
MTHSKMIKAAVVALARFDRKMAIDVEASVLHLKAVREMLSYRAPSSGDQFQKPNFDIIDNCRMFLEIAQLQSELLEASIEKHVSTAYPLEKGLTDRVCHNVIDGIEFFDSEDSHRISYLARKHPTPTNIMHMLSPGHEEDFYGAWCRDGYDTDSSDDSFDPDWGRLMLFKME